MSRAPLRAAGFVGAYHPDLGGAPRRVADDYPTPPDVTLALLEHAPPPEGVLQEPACGNGAMARVLRGAGYPVAASDLRFTGYGTGGVDYLRAPPLRGLAGIVTNPPFRDAEAFARKALAEAPYVAMLFKATFWNARRRAALFAIRPPSMVLALTWRPAFLLAERGNQPMMDVAWTIWDQRLGPLQRYELALRPAVPPLARVESALDRIAAALGAPEPPPCRNALCGRPLGCQRSNCSVRAA